MIDYLDRVVTTPDEARTMHKQGTLGDTRIVYAFLDCVGTPLYVGQTWDPLTRFTTHRLKAKWWRSARRVVLFYVEGDKSACELERAAIAILKPKHNKVRYKGATA
jgi:predicted GIY-YIG superfamily endonuclease